MISTGRKVSAERHAVNVAAGIRVNAPWHVQIVNSNYARPKEWMRRFKGVTTRYLDSYLGWFRAIERSPAAVTAAASFLAMAVGA